MGPSNFQPPAEGESSRLAKLCGSRSEEPLCEERCLLLLR